MQLTLEPSGTLLLHREKVEPVDVRAQRSFPWSAPNRFVILRDREGDELVAIDDMNELPETSRAALSRWLEQHSFIPRVRRVFEVRSGVDAIVWDIETDRGRRKFRMKEREDMRYLQDGRHVLRDDKGGLYELPPIETLDRESQDALRLVL